MVLGGRWLEVLHQLFERAHRLRIAHQLFLHLLDLLHQLLGLRFLGDLQQHGLSRRRDNHLSLLPQQLDALAAKAGALIVAMAQLQAKPVKLALQRG